MQEAALIQALCKYGLTQSPVAVVGTGICVVMCECMCVLTGWAKFALIDYLTVTHMAKVNKGSGVMGYF